MPNGNGSGYAFDLRLVVAILIPVLTLAVAWGTIQTRLDHITSSTLKLERKIDELSIAIIDLRIAQQEDLTFRQQWLARWGHFLSGGPSD